MESVEMSLAQKIYDEAKEQLQQVAELRTWKTSLGKKMTA